jgi:hypothetical protein
MTDKNKNSAADYTPVIGFVVSYFIFHLFEWQEATHFVFSTMISLAIFMIELRLIKDEYELNRKSIKSSNFFTGLLSLVTAVVFIIGILSWLRSFSYTWRMALLLVSVVIYIAILFRAINFLISVKQISEKKKPSR